MADDDKQGHLSRRTLLIGGGAGVGLLVAWAVWPRTYAPNLTAARGEHIMGAWLTIGEDGHIVVAVPQAEHGQGVYTTLPQIIDHVLGAECRHVGVAAVPLTPLYTHPTHDGDLICDLFAALPKRSRALHSAPPLQTRTDGRR